MGHSAENSDFWGFGHKYGTCVIPPKAQGKEKEAERMLEPEDRVECWGMLSSERGMAVTVLNSQQPWLLQYLYKTGLINILS